MASAGLATRTIAIASTPVIAARTAERAQPLHASAVGASVDAIAIA